MLMADDTWLATPADVLPRCAKQPSVTLRGSSKLRVVSSRSIAVVVALVGALAFVVVRRTHSESGMAKIAPPASAPPAATAPNPSASEAEPWPANPVTYDCRALAPDLPSVSPPLKNEAPASVIVRKSRQFSASAVSCGAGLPLSRADVTELDAAIAGARPPAEPFARAVVQNSAISIARCARPNGTGDDSPAAAQITQLKAHARRLVQRLALDAAAIASFDAATTSPLDEWIGADAAGAARAAKVDSPTHFHSRASGSTIATRRLGTVRGADAFYGDLVVIDTDGQAHALPLAAELMLRQTSDHGLTVCFAVLGDPLLYPTPALRPVTLPAGPLDIGGIRCDRCHIHGKRLSEQQGTVTGADVDRAALEDVSSWYHSTAQ
jgi:hypothetical protein